MTSGKEVQRKVDLKGSLFHPDLRAADYAPQVVAYYFKQWLDFQMPFHTHDATEIMYVIAGRCEVELQEGPGGASRVIALKKGEFILLDANVPHRLTVRRETPCRMLNVEFRFLACNDGFPVLRKLAEENEELAVLLKSPVPYLVLRDAEEAYHTLKSLVLELDDRGTDRSTMARLLLAQLLLRVARLLSEAQRNEQQPAERYVKQAIAFMHQNYDRELRVSEVAAAVSLHPGYLHRIFKQQMGRTLTDYLTELRMEKAKMLLRQTDIPILELCDYVGVGSRQYFHSLFKSYTGQTPAEFRKRNLQKSPDVY